ncbi:MAG: hypothetical protein Q4P36_03120 [Bowdeniella nasicola]|nr:hypothetical protein [Bowdeniella nasicola]
MYATRFSKIAAITAVLALVGTMFLSFLALPAMAATYQNFREVYSTQTNGAVTINGNTLMTCDRTNKKCRDLLTNPDSKYNNNNVDMVELDVDNDPSTSNSSMASLAMTDGATVLHARLFWGARANKASGVKRPKDIPAARTMKFKTPGGAYESVTATEFFETGSHYSANADVTELVKAAGAGDYWGADVFTHEQADGYAGWSLVVVYEDPALPMRDLRVYSGYKQISGPEVTTTVEGFRAPPEGIVKAEVGVIAYEGDPGYRNDYFEVDGQRIGDDLSPTTNFFNSKTGALGESRTDRNPNDINTIAVDAKTFDASGILKNSATKMDLTFGTGGDWYYPTALTTQIDLYVPEIKPVKTVKNLAGNDPAAVGDVLEYSIAVSNTGQDSAVNTVLTDLVPSGATFIPGTLKTAVNGGALVPATDDVGDDVGDYSDGKLTVRIGEGANETDGGTITTTGSATVTFRVKVENPAADTTLANKADVSYTEKTTGKKQSMSSNGVDTPVASLADVSIVKSGPDSIAAGEQIEWTLTVRNDGPRKADDVVVTDTLPDDVTFVSAAGAECSADGQDLSCDLGTVELDAEVPIAVTAQVSPDATADSLANSASVSSSTPDPDGDNNSSSFSTPLKRSADLSLTKSVDPAAIAPGETTTWTLTGTNAGPSSAKDVTIADTLPQGFTITELDDQCTNSGNDVTCSVGDLAPDSSVSVTVTARLDEAWTETDPVENSANVGSKTPDPNKDNNTAVASVTPTEPQADLRIEKRTTTSPVQAGLPVTYDIVVTNDGPSQATGLSVSDNAPDSLTNVSASAGVSTCTTEGNDLTCVLDSLAVGASETITVSADVRTDAIGELSNTASVSSETNDPNPGNDTATATDTVATSADLKIEKTSSPAVAGDTFTYTLKTTNLGTSDARDVVITDTLPAEVDYISAEPASGCSASSDTVTCQMGTVAASDSASVVITVRLHADVADDTSVTNTASVDSSTPDPDPGNNSATSELVTDADADIRVAKSGPDQIIAGEPVTWTIDVTNDGPSDAINASLTDSIPDGVSGVSVSSTAGSCDASATEVSCAFDTLAASGTVTVTVSGTVAESFTGDELVNDASASSDTNDPSPSNNADRHRIGVRQMADLSVTKTGSATVSAGEPASWEITITNAGPSVAREVSVVDTLPASITYTGSTSEDGVTCEASGTSAVDCALASLGAGASATVTITGDVAPDTKPGSTLENSVSVSSSTPEDPDKTGDNTASFSSNVEARADLAVVKSVEPDPLVSGSTGTYTVAVTNNGPATAVNAVVVDEMPAGLTPTSADAAGGECAIEDQTVTCTFASIGPNLTREIAIAVDVHPDVADSVTNSASVSSDTEDPTTDNNASSITTNVEDKADVELVKSTDRTEIKAGEVVTYTLTTRNLGPSTAEAVTVTDTIPDGMEFVTADDRCSVEDQTITCALGDLSSGENAAPTVTLGVPPESTATSFTNGASASSTTPDPNPDNNASEAPVSVSTAADVSITKSVTPDVVLAGEPATWKIVVMNDGPSVARNVHVIDTLPDGLTLRPAADDSDACTATGQTIDCALGDVYFGAVVIEVDTMVDADYAGTTIANTVDVASDTPDPNPDNNTGEASARVLKRADLSVTKTLDTNPLVPGEKVSYTVVVTNNGPSDAPKVQVDDTVPEEITGLEASIESPDTSGDVECTITDDREVFCAAGRLPSGASATVTITGTLNPSVTKDVTNAVTVGSAVTDPDGTNNTASATGTPAPSADLAITKTLVGGATPGEPVTWEITLSSTGPSTATDVRISDELPASVKNATLAQDGSACALDGAALECTFEAFAPGQTYTVNVTGDLDAAARGELTNTVDVTSATSDPNEENNSAIAVSPLTPSADLMVFKELASPATPGEPVSWEISVGSAGPSTATNVVVTDPLPAGVTNVSLTQDGDACRVADGAVTCTWDAFDPSDDYSVLVTGDLEPGASGELTNQASITSDTPDPDESNNTAIASDPMTPEADLVVLKTAVGPATPGTTVAWEITVSSLGPSSATNVVVSDELPEHVANATLSQDGDACGVQGRTLTCGFDVFKPGATYSLVVYADLDHAASGELTNQVSVSSDTPDPDESNNAATVSVPTTPVADLAVTKKQIGAAKAGEAVAWEITVTSAGPSSATNVIVSDELPEHVANVVVSEDGNACEVKGRTLTCVFDTFAPGENYSLTVKGDLPEDATGELTNTVSVTSDTPDPDADNNAAVASGPIQPTPPASPDLPITGSNAGATTGLALALVMAGGLLAATRRQLAAHR